MFCRHPQQAGSLKEQPEAAVRYSSAEQPCQCIISTGTGRESFTNQKDCRGTGREIVNGQNTFVALQMKLLDAFSKFYIPLLICSNVFLEWLNSFLGLNCERSILFSSVNSDVLDSYSLEHKY